MASFPRMASAVDAKLMKQTKFPPEFNQKADMNKVNLEVLKKWIAGRISEILGTEDDVVVEFCFNHLEGSRYPDIKSLQIQLTGFLDKDTAKFCQELWSLCLSAQDNPQGVPKELLEAKKLELIQEKLEAEKAAEAARRQKEQEQVRERELDNVRRRERFDRGRGRGRGFDRRSPLPRDQDRHPGRLGESQSRRDFDSYVPPSPRRGRQSSSPHRNYRNWNGRHWSRERRRSSPGRSVSPQRRNHGGARRPSSNYGDRARSKPILSRNYSRSPVPKGKNSSSRSRSPVRSRRHSDRSYRDRDARHFGRSPDLSRNRDRFNDRDHARRRRGLSGSSDITQKDPDTKHSRPGDREETPSRKQHSPPVDFAPQEKCRKTADGHPDSSSSPKTYENATNDSGMAGN